MAKIKDTNLHLKTQEQRIEATVQHVVASSAYEGIQVSPEHIRKVLKQESSERKARKTS